MIIELHPSFKKFYKKRIACYPKLVIRTAERISLFKNNPKHPLLKDHSLTGEKSQLRAFWITGDVRLVYFPVSKDRVIFLDIGSHNQVY
jgi:addiction module RelE/StbE family toxin